MNRRVAEVPLDILKRVPLFEGLDELELQAVAGAMAEVTFGAGETVVVEGAEPDGFYVVVAGEAAVTVRGVQSGTMVPGDWLGEIALLTGSERTATITAATDLRCYRLRPLDFRALVEGSPAIAWKVLESTAERLS